MWHFNRTELSVSPSFSVSVFVQSLQMRKWISSTVWTTAARQPPTPTTLPHRAPPARPTRPPTHTRTPTLIRTNTLLPCRHPTRTRPLKHIGPTGTHTCLLHVQFRQRPSLQLPIISPLSMQPPLQSPPSIISLHPSSPPSIFLFFLISSRSVKVREAH